ncbi:hypothetical protein LSH36_845g00032, partial [Paralvinella palmiformis]
DRSLKSGQNAETKHRLRVAHTESQLCDGASAAPASRAARADMWLLVRRFPVKSTTAANDLLKDAAFYLDR